MEPDEPPQGKPPLRWRRLLGGGASVALLIFILVGVIPTFASYSSAWRHLTHLGVWSWVAIAGAAVLNQISGVWPYQAAMPGLRLWPGILQIETATAISNTVPAGGAVAIGMTYKMFSSFGFSDVVISTAVVTTGIWNIGARLALPVMAVAWLAVTGHPKPLVVDAALAGVVVIAVSGVALWLALRSEVSARWLGHQADRLVNRVLHLFGKPSGERIEHALLHFRNQTIQVVRHRGSLLTAAALANQAAGFILILIIVEAVGISAGRMTVAAVFTAFAVARLASAIPITPGGLGTFDAAFIGLMKAFGTGPSQALTADVVWRLATYLLPILCGIVTYLVWIRRQARSVSMT
jgi:putative heme transporter